ncbi:hypothetical protein CC2G_002917 [Coprinopsis cinerea AmutBmut pab1-1]|nr:hypothetical protein CC2G_002917 [Coprinopsis cinerea AmutBmut pab1-1]
MADPEEACIANPMPESIDRSSRDQDHRRARSRGEIIQERRVEEIIAIAMDEFARRLDTLEETVGTVESSFKRLNRNHVRLESDIGDLFGQQAEFKAILAQNTESNERRFEDHSRNVNDLKESIDDVRRDLFADLKASKKLGTEAIMEIFDAINLIRMEALDRGCRMEELEVEHQKRLEDIEISVRNVERATEELESMVEGWNCPQGRLAQELGGRLTTRDLQYQLQESSDGVDPPSTHSRASSH